MHSPSTIAFERTYPWYAKNKRPWPKRIRHLTDLDRAWDIMTAREKIRCDRLWPNGYSDAWLTIWHEDPQRHSDDSCGFTVPHLTNEQLSRLKALAWDEARNRYFLRSPGKNFVGTRHEAECLFRGLMLQIAEYLRVPMSFDEAAKIAALRVHSPDTSDGAGVLCFQPGYHTNFQEDTREAREEYFFGKVCSIARWEILKPRRPWWRHPRWHIRHWRIQVHPLQRVRHWLFDRCEKCGARFGFDEPIASTAWDPPQSQGWARLAFWRSKPCIVCDKCSGRNVKVVTGESANEPSPPSA